MAQHLDRTASAWRFPVFRFLALLTALFCALMIFQMWLWSANPLESFYLDTYARLSLVPDLSRFHFGLHQKLPEEKSFPVVFKGGFVATTAKLEVLDGPFSIGHTQWANARFQGWLRENIFGGQSIFGFFRVPFFISFAVLIILYFSGSLFDRRQVMKARRGISLRGPGLVRPWRFNLKTKGDGLTFPLDNQVSLGERCLPSGWASALRLRRDREAHHIQIAGDTGAGKSTLIRQILYQVEARETDVAIIFDPDREYIKEFFREDRGDWVLNPKDDRCPYWPIGDEVTDETDARPVANGFFPEDPTSQKFFLEHTRAIFTYLLARYKPTVNELAYWMAHPNEIDRRVRGTEHETTLTKNAPPMRAGILATLNHAGAPLRMMPSHAEGRRTWTAREYTKTRKGWIFITSTPETIDALRPVQTLWLDMLILKLQTSEPIPGQPRVWMIFDELASLNALSQLHSAITKQRKSGNPLVLGFQGMSQLDGLYGKKAETILSQAFSNFILRTREPRASKHLSDFLGKAQLERLRESQPRRLFQWRAGSYSTERVTDSVVMDSEIQGLEDLEGYFVQKNSVVPIQIHRMEKRIIAPDLIERIIPPMELRRLDPENPPNPESEAPVPDTSPTGGKPKNGAAKTPRKRKAKEEVPPSSPQPEITDLGASDIAYT